MVFWAVFTSPNELSIIRTFPILPILFILLKNFRMNKMGRMKEKERMKEKLGERLGLVIDQVNKAVFCIATSFDGSLANRQHRLGAG